MLDASRAKKAAEPLVRLYQDIEDDMLRNIAKRLKFRADRGAENIVLQDWYIERMAEMGLLNRENTKAIAKKAGIATEQLAKAINDLGYDALKVDESLYQMAFVEGKLGEYMPVNVQQSPYLQGIMRNAVEMAGSELNMINTTMIGTAKAAYISAVNKAYLNVATGTMDWQGAIRLVLKDLADKGIKGVKYESKNGTTRTDYADVAVRRNILTTSSQAAGKMQMQRAQEWGSDLVEVTSHMGARPSHAAWQGQVYSLSGKSKKYRSFREATRYGEVDGLKGINCRHDFYPFFEGISEHAYKPYDLKENERIYNLEQQQRKMEREIRHSKRRLIASDAAGDTELAKKYAQAVKDGQKELRDFIKSNDLVRRNDREQVQGYSVDMLKKR